MKKFVVTILLLCGLDLVVVPHSGSETVVPTQPHTFYPVTSRSARRGRAMQRPRLYGGGRRRAIGSQPQADGAAQRPVSRPVAPTPRSRRVQVERRQERQPEGVRGARQKKSTAKTGSGVAAKSGMRNLGNTCFMNAALQALYEIEPLREFIIQWGTQLYSDPLINDLSALFKKMRDSRLSVIDPDTFVQFVWHVRDKSDRIVFRKYRQGDSHEFVTFLMHRLVTSVRPEFQDLVQKFLEVSMMYTYESIYTVPTHWHVGDEPREEKEHGLFMELLIEQPDLPLEISRLIDAVSIPQYVKLAPRRVLTYFTEVTDASLALWDRQQKLSFSEFERLLARYKEGIEEWQYQVISAELNAIRDTREKYRNFFEQKYEDKKAFESVLRNLVSLLKDAVREGVEKGIRLSELPPYLSIQLKLFETGHGASLRKITHHVHTPMLLTVPSVPGSLLYRLKAVVIHTGTVDSGHYYAYTRTGNKWYECNDQRVTPLTEQHVIRELQKKTPYLVFYQREDITQEFVNERLEEFERAIVLQVATAADVALEPGAATVRPTHAEALVPAEQQSEYQQMIESFEDLSAEFPELAGLIESSKS